MNPRVFREEIFFFLSRCRSLGHLLPLTLFAFLLTTEPVHCDTSLAQPSDVNVCSDLLGSIVGPKLQSRFKTVSATYDVPANDVGPILHTVKEIPYYAESVSSQKTLALVEETFSTNSGYEVRSVSVKQRGALRPKYKKDLARFSNEDDAMIDLQHVGYLYHAGFINKTLESVFAQYKERRHWSEKFIRALEGAAYRHGTRATWITVYRDGRLVGTIRNSSAYYRIRFRLKDPTLGIRDRFNQENIVALEIDNGGPFYKQNSFSDFKGPWSDSQLPERLPMEEVLDMQFDHERPVIMWEPHPTNAGEYYGYGRVSEQSSYWIKSDVRDDVVLEVWAHLLRSKNDIGVSKSDLRGLTFVGSTPEETNKMSMEGISIRFNAMAPDLTYGKKDSARVYRDYGFSSVPIFPSQKTMSDLGLEGQWFLLKSNGSRWFKVAGSISDWWNGHISDSDRRKFIQKFMFLMALDWSK